jgi:predicted 3-demethylubiquinone-9 3-methyltransferase (glyoxalase superfamily)
MAVQKITTFLWYDDQAEEAANLYVSLFPDSRVLEVSRGEDGKAFVVTFELAGQRLMALNGGPAHAGFTESVSLYVSCRDQAEVDELWARLTADGGEESRCGWLKDKFGLSWQIIPTALPALIGDRAHPEKARRAMEAMLGMAKIDVEGLRRAYEGG